MAYPYTENKRVKNILDTFAVNSEAANQEVLKRFQDSDVRLVGMGIAKDVIPGMHDKMILHAGPPITWERMCGPMKGAVIGALLYEGLAKNDAEAIALIESGQIQFDPNHEHQAVGPMAGESLALWCIWRRSNQKIALDERKTVSR